MAWITLTRVIRTKNPERTIPSVSEGRIRCATASTKAGRVPASRLSIVYSPVTVGGGERGGVKLTQERGPGEQNAQALFSKSENQKSVMLFTYVPWKGQVKCGGRFHRRPA